MNTQQKPIKHTCRMAGASKSTKQPRQIECNTRVEAFRADGGMKPAPSALLMNEEQGAADQRRSCRGRAVKREGQGGYRLDCLPSPREADDEGRDGNM